MASNGELPPRAERVCKNCDHCRRAGTELRCWFGPPQPCFLYMGPPKLAGLPPVPVIHPVQPPTWPDYSCSHWAERQPDHPDLQPADPIVLPTHEVSTEPQ